MVCLSGGKDSLSLLHTLHQYQCYSKSKVCNPDLVIRSPVYSRRYNHFAYFFAVLCTTTTVIIDSWLNSLTLFWLAETVQWIFEISACDIITADYTIIMSRTLKVTGNHVKFARFVLLPVSEEAKTWLPFFFVQCIIKQLLDKVFVISRIIKVSVRPSASADNRLIILDITKTSSNNCLEMAISSAYFWRTRMTATIFLYFHLELNADITLLAWARF